MCVCVFVCEKTLKDNKAQGCITALRKLSQEDSVFELHTGLNSEMLSKQMNHETT